MPTSIPTRTRGRAPVRTRKNSRSKIVIPDNRGIKVVRSITIRRPAGELYTFWRDASNLTRIIRHPATIETRSRDESHWSISAPMGHRVEWDALLINDRPNELIAWRTREGSDVVSAGSVRFEAAPGDEGTEVTVSLEYDPPGGKIGAAIAKLTRDSASSQVYDALHRFKALMEAGGIPTTEGQPAAGPRRKSQDKGGR